MHRDRTEPFIFHGRSRELAQIGAFLRDRGPGFTHLRGRRRIGKTELLLRVRDSSERSFYFAGRDDEGNRETLKRFAREWDRFIGKPRLTRLKVSELNWDDLMGEIGHASAQDGLILLLDEVQWLAAKGVGFCGLLKEHWSAWKKSSEIKVILAGSSNRFFHRYTDGENTVLRGVRTHAPIWVDPFTLTEVREFYFPQWTAEEICLVHMMIGGVPYYLENIDVDGNFLRSINRSIFQRRGIFLDEADAVLKLETSTGVARRRVKEVLACLGSDGATQAQITANTGLEQDRVHKIIERLLDYGMIRERWPLGRRRGNRAGVRFVAEDPYLNFYFQVLLPREQQIRANENRMMFSTEVLSSSRGYYISGFSGAAFERLITAILEDGRGDESRRAPRLFEVLSLQTGRYEVGTYWEPGRTQIDIVVRGLDDREVRIIEAKWMSSKAGLGRGLLNEVQAKKYPFNENEQWRRRYYLALSGGASKGLLESARAQDIGVIELEDLF